MVARFEMVEVTPAIAEEWLKKVNIQRKLGATTVAAYARDMAAGRWSDDATAICFNGEGDLVNGQHRLHAVIQSKVTVTFLVMHGASLEAILRMDSGRPRTVADQLHIFGVANATDIGAVSRTVLMYDGFPEYVWSGNMVTMSRAEVADYALTHAPQFQVAVKAARSLRDRAPGANKTAMGALHFLVNRDSPNANLWNDFYTGLWTGADLTVGDSRLALRNYLASPNRRDWGYAQQSNLFVGLKAWNAYALDREVRLMRSPRRSELPMPKAA